MNHKSLFWDLTFKLETFTHTVPVPFAVYYAVITQKMSLEKWISFLELILVFAVGIGILGTLWRYFFLKKLFKRIELIRLPDSGSNISYTYQDRDEAKAIKKLLFRLPKIEAWIIVFRWFLGVIPIVTIFSLAVEYVPGVIRSGVFTLLMIPPISYVTYYFITEKSIRPLFDHPKLQGIELRPEEVPLFDYSKRIFLAFVSLALMPVSVLSYILYSVATGNTMVEDPMIPILVVSGIFIIPLVTCSRIVANTVKQGIADTNLQLSEFAKGNIETNVIPKSGDDFGQQAFYLNTIVKRLRDMVQEIKQLNEGLEENVRQRTEELNATLSEIQILKHQQDGDYFLTHLLLHPLAVWALHSNKFQISQILKQKKNFEFQGSNYEIGGDLNIAYTITLQGKKYNVILNSDAMGKSMQGAGGSLVLGAIFSSILQRTERSTATKVQSPERWMSDAFLEMHHLFESFDGTMMISLVLLLIEEETGFLYHINAEHPWIVLIRDEKASYLETEQVYRKLGTLGKNQEIHISTFRLFPKDILILGSDGRDDLQINQGQNQTTMNVDEMMFLRLAESNSKELKTLLQALEETGETIDDLSLIRIEYVAVKEEMVENIEVMERESKQNKAKMHYWMENLDFHKALALGEKHFSQFPWDREGMELLQKVYGNVGEIEKSQELAFRLALRSNKKPNAS